MRYFKKILERLFKEKTIKGVTCYGEYYYCPACMRAVRITPYRVFKVCEKCGERLTCGVGRIRYERYEIGMSVIHREPIEYTFLPKGSCADEEANHKQGH